VIAGIIFILASLFAGTVWFIFAEPIKRYNHFEDTMKYSEHQYREIINKVGVFHYSFSKLGRIGNKESVKILLDWLIAYEKSCPGQPKFSDFDYGFVILEELTNQPINKDLNKWSKWLEKNSDKTQEEWIISGFEARGIKPGDPVTKKDIITLLKLLAKDTKKITPLKLNCYRWLRFKDNSRLLKDFKIAEITDEDKEIVFKGLRNYAYMMNVYTYPASINPFIKDDRDKICVRPTLFMPSNMLLIDSGIVISFLLGTGLIVYSRKRDKAHT
jgi:hypothetical protein